MPDSDSNTFESLGRILASVFGIATRPYDTKVQLWAKVARSLGIRVSPYDSLESILARIAATNPTGGSSPSSDELIPNLVGGPDTYIDIEGVGLNALVSFGVTQLFFFFMVDITGMKTLVFPNLTTVNNSTGGIELASCAELETISLPVLAGVLPHVNFEDMPALTSFSAPGAGPGVASPTVVLIDCPNLAVFDAPNLLTGATGFGFLIITNIGPVSLDIGLTELVECGILDLENCPGFSGNKNFSTLNLLFNRLTVSGTSATGLQFPLLPSIGANLAVENNPLLTNLSLPLVVTVAGNVTIKNNATLVSLDVSSMVPFSASTDDYSGNALNQASVDGVLARYAANAGYLAGTIDLSGGTNSAPSPTGAADKATLIGRGVTVITN